MDLLAWTIVGVVFVAFVLLLLWGLDRHLCLKDAEADLNIYLGDLLVARDASEPPFRVHFDAHVFAVKSIIRKNFGYNGKFPNQSSDFHRH